MKGLKYVAAGLSGVLFISLCAGCAAKEGKDEGAVSYVGIDVNPSVSLMLDKNNKVVSVIAENEDAQVLLYGEASLVGMSAEDAAKRGHLTASTVIQYRGAIIPREAMPA